jgi:histidinol-phosphate aminotransferase
VTVRFSSTLAELPLYVPGRTVPGAIKLASNETPYPPLPHVLARIAESARMINRYPDAASVQRRERLARKLALDPDQIAVGCGSVSLCGQLVRAVADPGDEVIYAWRSFEAYPMVTALGAAAAVPVPLAGYVHDLDAMAAAITDRTRLIFVCNPNNPTGTAVSRDALTGFLDQVPPDVLVALDEAYFEFVSDPGVANGVGLLADYPNLVVLRTFSKAYGLAGLRVGYAAAADPAVASALRRTQLPFVVSQLAQDAAVASLEPEAERQLFERVSELVAERARVRAALRGFGYDVAASEANFVWLPLGAGALSWAAGAADRKVIVRAFACDGVRITVSNRDENDRLLETAQELASN